MQVLIGLLFLCFGGGKMVQYRVYDRTSLAYVDGGVIREYTVDTPYARLQSRQDQQNTGEINSKVCKKTS